ncbi:MAG: GTP-binding protein, partial [Burkholderiaceae bacterium]
QTFFMDDTIAEYYLLDAVITVVDAKHGGATLDAQPEAQNQVGFADRILLSKTDLVSEAEATELKARLRAMNPRAPIKPVHMGEIAVAEVLDLRGFNLNAVLDIDPAFLSGDSHHHHDDAISSFVFQSNKAFDPAKLEEYLGALTQVYGQDLLRYKGVLFMDGTNRRMIFQGVHMLMGADVGRPWGKDEKPSSKIVFIGRNLPRDAILNGLGACLAR